MSVAFIEMKLGASSESPLVNGYVVFFGIR